MIEISYAMYANAVFNRNLRLRIHVIYHDLPIEQNRITITSLVPLDIVCLYN